MLPLLLAAAALTAQEAQTLSVADLAARVLGAAGAVVVDVQRPRWPECVGLCPPPAPRPDGPPPLTTLTFYTRAGMTADAGWVGLCRATAITVGFDPAGAVTGVEQRPTIGWLGALTRQVAVDRPADRAAASEQRAGFDARCRALPTTGDFVLAAGALDGERVLIAVALIHDSMMSGGGIRATCADAVSPGARCDTPAARRAFADAIAVGQVTGYSRVDARTGLFVTGGAVDGGCYRVSLAQSFGASSALDLCLTATLDRVTVTRARYARDRIIY